MPKLIGLTGGIGTGKSTVSRQFNRLGVPIIDADQIAHQLQRRGTECYNAIVKTFGPAVGGLDAIDRNRLGAIVFADVAQLVKLNRTMDLYLRRAILDQIQRYQSTSVVVLDAPLLYESGYANYVDLVVVVSCTPAMQVARLKNRNHIQTAQALNLLRHQWPQGLKCELADVIINNSGSIKQTNQQVTRLLAEL